MQNTRVKKTSKYIFKEPYDSSCSCSRHKAASLDLDQTFRVVVIDCCSADNFISIVEKLEGEHTVDLNVTEIILCSNMFTYR